MHRATIGWHQIRGLGFRVINHLHVLSTYYMLLLGFGLGFNLRVANYWDQITKLKVRVSNCRANELKSHVTVECRVINRHPVSLFLENE